MDLNFSQESFAFSDIAPPSHVSGLESFSGSECSEVSFAEIAPNKADDSKDGEAFVGEDPAQSVISVEKSKDRGESGGNER